MRQTFYLISLIIGFCITVVCRAGDMAEFQVIGFTPGGKYFAFEQYGVQDGSGFSYSDIFIIDTTSDIWVKGSPIRVELEDETLSKVRKISALRAAPVLKQLNILQTTQPLLNHLEKRDNNGIDIFTFKLGEVFEYSLNLKHWQTNDVRCQRYGVSPELFSLSISKNAEVDNNPRILHKDYRLPRSRGCPIKYAIDQLYISKGQEKSIAVIISVFTNGFEGSNRRFIAITSQID